MASTIMGYSTHNFKFATGLSLGKRGMSGVFSPY